MGPRGVRMRARASSIALRAGLRTPVKDSSFFLPGSADSTLAVEGLDAIPSATFV